MMESPVFTVEETAEYLKETKGTIYVLVRSKDFPAIKIGRQWRILKHELDEWLIKRYNNKPENLVKW